MVELLLRNGTSESTRAVDKDNNTPFHLAAQGGHASIVELHPRKGAPAGALDKITILHYILLRSVVILIWWSSMSLKLSPPDLEFWIGRFPTAGLYTIA